MKVKPPFRIRRFGKTWKLGVLRGRGYFRHELKRIFKEERAQITAPGECCDRCKRVLDPWPLKRADVCSPKDWVYCIRNFLEDRRK